MGYRNYIGKIDNTKLEAIKDMSLEELKRWYSNATGEKFGENGYLSMRPYKIATSLHELGKYCELQYLEPFEKRLFTHDECEEYFNEEDELKIIGKEGFEAIIDDYRKKILNYFSKLKPESEITEKEKILENIKSFRSEIEDKIKTWGENCEQYKLFPYNLNLNTDEIVGSWKYEYAIFELVRVYKSIDWDNEQVVLLGW